MTTPLRFPSLTRRAFLGATLTGVAARIGSASQNIRDGSGERLAVSPLDTWAIVETTSGTYVVGELLIRNALRTPVELTDLRLNTETFGPPIFRVTASDLLARLANATNSTPATSLTIHPDDAVLAFLWEALQNPATALFAAMNFKATQADRPHIGAVTIELLPALTNPVRLDPPLAGGPWVAVYDPHVPRGHRRVAFTHEARLVVPARFAIDWIRLDDSGRATDGGPNDFGRWYGFGADVFAVADAKVVAVRDSYPDVLTSERPQKRSEDDVSGNYVGLALPSGQFAFYEHLQQGSLRVKVGDTVSAGQPIARLGRSGINSAGPHLHFHVGSAPSTLNSQGRPFTLSQFRLLGGYPSMAAALGGTRWSSDGAASPSRLVQNLLPAANVVVMFDPA